MSFLRTFAFSHSAILRLNSEKARIDTAPDYQRRGEIWNLEKKQLLIDSILNDYDMPKLYFHSLSASQRKASGGKFDFAIIDGRQRLEAIWGFLEGQFALSPEFEVLSDKDVKAAGLTYEELSLKFPKLRIRFDSFVLPIICVETDDLDLIEDMFSRLNEAVPLNAAERRNAIGGPMAQAIKSLESHKFFEKCVKFSNKRYQYREVIARLFYIEYSLEHYGKLTDTKKPYLDGMVRSYKKEASDPTPTVKQVQSVLDMLAKKFSEDDSLLSNQAPIVVYYLVGKTAVADGKVDRFDRAKIVKFYDKISKNREIAETDITSADFELLEYERLSQQGTNDSTSIRERARILGKELKIIPKSVETS